MDEKKTKLPSETADLSDEALETAAGGYADAAFPLKATGCAGAQTIPPLSPPPVRPFKDSVPPHPFPPKTPVTKE